MSIGLATTALGLILTGVFEQQVTDSVSREAENRVRALSQGVARELSQDLADRQTEVRLIANLLKAGEGLSSTAVQTLLDDLQRSQPAYAWIGLVKLTGMVDVATSGVLHKANVSARPWFIEAQKGFHLGEPREAQLLAKLMQNPDQSGEPLRFIDIAMPVEGLDGQTQWILGAHLHWSWIKEVVRVAVTSRLLTGILEVDVHDQAGNLLYRFTTDAEGLPAPAKGQGATIQFHESVANLQVRSGYPMFGWKITARRDIRPTQAAIQQAKITMYSVTALISLLFIAGAWLVSGRLVRPVVRLAQEAREHLNIPDNWRSATQTHTLNELSVVSEVLERMAKFDTLTGLPNKGQMLKQLGTALADGVDVSRHGALLLINIDDVRLLHHTHGSALVEQLLVAIAQRLCAFCHPGESAYRIGEDDFVLLLPDLDAQGHAASAVAQSRAQAVLELFRAPFALGAGPCACTVSIGVSVIGTEAMGPQDALLCADMALRDAKAHGKNAAMLFTPALRDRLSQRIQFENQLKAAIPTQLHLVYQPQVHDSGRLLGAETLVRWMHPTEGMVSPARFIPLAEATGLIIDIGRWVFQTACGQVKRWETDPELSKLVLSVNVSAHEFNEPAFIDQIRDTLHASGARPDRLKIELTESALAEDINMVIQKMQELHGLGMSISLDDFGTGYSSLSYLQKMPIDQLKIDQSFVRTMTNNPDDNAIAQMVIALGRSMRINVIAEGVETQDQVRLLQKLGCHEYQGYFFAKPLPLDAFETFARTPLPALLDRP